MILLLGGTSETAPIAEALASQGRKVLVSKCTDFPLDTGIADGISVRTGPLDRSQLLALIETESIKAIVDATHPYAVEITKTAKQICLETGISYYRFERPGTDYADENVYFADSHQQAAEIACSFQSPILLTTGANNLEAYVAQAKTYNSELFARVLPFKDSIDKCAKRGLDEEHIIPAKGPFSEQENLELLSKHSIGVIVTKDSGTAGGIETKLNAAKKAACKMVIVTRNTPTDAEHYPSIDELIEAIKTTL